jgi:hypothetical protein
MRIVAKLESRRLLNDLYERLAATALPEASRIDEKLIESIKEIIPANIDVLF